MTCYHPMTGYRSSETTKNGKRKIVFSPQMGYTDLPVTVPCGQCIGCRLERSRQWAIRCMHEASLYDDNCFLTLTYDDAHLPENGSLVLEHWQRFFKRLRKRFGAGIRFYHCGEYGERFGRPHYHACVFGFDFPDKKVFMMSNGIPVYVSESLSQLWPYGHSLIGTVTFESAAYVARYIMKKVLGESAEDHYTRVDSETGEVIHLRPEYTTMSRRPGIGRLWLDKWMSDVYPSDEVIVRGKAMKPPKFYDSVFELSYPDDFRRLKSRRIIDSRSHADNCTDDRLRVREEVQHSRLTRLIRPLEVL